MVTGGASGIGAACVEALAAQGVAVAVLDRDEQAGGELLAKLESQGRSASFRKVDLRDVERLERTLTELVAEIPPIRVLVNTAARDDRHRPEEVTLERWDDIQATSLRHVFFATKTLAPAMAEAGGGSVINFSSTCWIRKSPNLTGYATAKAGVVGMSRALAREYGPQNIRVNVVTPGWVMTQRQRDLWLTPEGEQKLLDEQCLKTTIAPEDVAELVNFLASDSSRMITSQTLTIDAGWT